MKVSVVTDAGVNTEVGLEKVTVRGVPLSEYLSQVTKLKEEVKRLTGVIQTNEKFYKKALADAEKTLDERLKKALAERDKHDAELEQRFLKIWRSVK